MDFIKLLLYIFGGFSSVSPKRTEKLIAELKTWCKAHGVRQYEAAKALGVSAQTVTEWIKGRNQPTGEQVLAIQEFLNNPRKQKSK